MSETPAVPQYRGPDFLLRVLQRHVIGEKEAVVLEELAQVLSLIDRLQEALNAVAPTSNGKVEPDRRRAPTTATARGEARLDAAA